MLERKGPGRCKMVALGLIVLYLGDTHFLLGQGVGLNDPMPLNL